MSTALDLHNKSRNELREALRRKGLSPSGVKEDLIRRLEGFGGNGAESFIDRDRDSTDSPKTSDDDESPPAVVAFGKRSRDSAVATVIDATSGFAVAEQFSPLRPPNYSAEENPICGHPNKYGNAM
jgi:hypothetical protein